MPSSHCDNEQNPQSPHTFQAPPWGQYRSWLSLLGYRMQMVWHRSAACWRTALSFPLRSWILIFQEVTALPGLFKSKALAQSWVGGVGGTAPGISASPVRPRSTFLCPVSSLPGTFSLHSSRQPRRERHVASFSFTWGLLKTRKVL